MKPPKVFICPVCLNQFEKRNSLQKVCSPKCAVKYNKDKQDKKEAKEVETKVKAYKHDLELNDLSVLKDRLQVYINKIVRFIDKGHPCMSSGRETYTVHAGHFFSRGSHENLRYHLLNIWAQSDSDNTYGGGQITSYRIRLLNTFGPELLDEIDGLKAKYPYLGLRKLDLLGHIQIARRIATELETAADKHFKETGTQLIYPTNERVELRRNFNALIGIYTDKI